MSRNSNYCFISVENKMKNSIATIRVHRYGTLWIWDISYIKGQDVNCRTNLFTVTSRNTSQAFYSKSSARGFLNELIRKVPDEFYKEFLEDIDIFDNVL